MPLLSASAEPWLQYRIRLGHFQNLLFDWSHRADTCGQQSVSQLGITGSHAAKVHGFSSSSVSTVRAILARLPIEHGEWVFADLGSGKGRTLLLAAAYPFKRVVGIEHAASLVAISRANLRTYVGKTICLNVEILADDALSYEPPADENLLVYLFNPFSADLIVRCIDRLATAPLNRGKRRMVCFVQQSTQLAPRIELVRLCTAVRPVALGPLPFDWLSHPQLEASLFDVLPTG